MKKKILFFLILILFVNTKASIQGDINLDGKVSSMDYIMLKNHILGNKKLSGNNLAMSDVNNDKKVNSLDYVLIKNIILKGSSTIITTPSNLTSEEKICESVKANGKIDYQSFSSLKKNGDDYYAIKAAHDCANKYDLPVVITKGEYHIYHKENGNITVKTSTDFNNSTIYIHDESGVVGILNTGHIYNIVSNNCSTKTMKFNNLKYLNTLTELSGSNNGKYIRVIDSTRKVYIRYGANHDNGVDAMDSFRVDKNGKVLDPLFWDYNNKNVSVYMCDIPSTTLTFKNANFYSIVDTTTSKTVKSSPNSVYLRRGIAIGRSNVVISNINHHYINSSKKIINEVNHGYYGFFNVNNAANLELSNLRVHSTKNNNSNVNSTYDIIIDNAANVMVKNVYMYDYDGTSGYFSKSSNQMKDDIWGVVGSNNVKNVTYDHCFLNRIDTHRGVYNETIKNTTVGRRGINAIGKGNLNIENVSIYYRNNMINLREDYGGIWDGNINVKNSEIHPLDGSQVYLIDVSIGRDSDGYVHNFGYDLRLPTVNLDNIKVYNNDSTFYIYNKTYQYFDDARTKGIKNSKYTFDFPRQNYLKNVYDKNGKSIKILNYYGK